MGRQIKSTLKLLKRAIGERKITMHQNKFKLSYFYGFRQQCIPLPLPSSCPYLPTLPVLAPNFAPVIYLVLIMCSFIFIVNEEAPGEIGDPRAAPLT